MKKPDSLGHLGSYAAICGLISREILSTHEVAEKLGVSHRVVHRFLRLMEDSLLAHVIDWIPPRARGGDPVEVWDWGYGVSVPCPPSARGSTRIRSRARPDGPSSIRSRFVSLIKCLEDGATREKIHQVSGISLRTLTYLLPLMRRQKLIRRATSIRRACGGVPVPVFTLGCGGDAPSPKPMPAMLTKRNYRDRKRQAKAPTQDLGYSVFSPVMPAGLTVLARASL